MKINNKVKKIVMTAMLATVFVSTSQIVSNAYEKEVGVDKTYDFYVSADSHSINESPIFNGIEDKTIKIGEKFDPLEGVEVTEKEYGDLTSSIKVMGDVDTSMPGNYIISYLVKDSKGVLTSVGRMITVVAEMNESPVFIGIEDKTIRIGENFNPLEGVEVTEKEYGDLTSSIKVMGQVDTSTPGNYIISYLVKDSKGVLTSVGRMITVK